MKAIKKCEVRVKPLNLLQQLFFFKSFAFMVLFKWNCDCIYSLAVDSINCLIFNFSQMMPRKVQGVLILIYHHWMFPLHSLKQLQLPSSHLLVRVMSKLHFAVAILETRTCSVVCMDYKFRF